jgi:putative redox protein
MTPPPRRIGELVLEIDMPAGLSAAHRARMEQAAHDCPVMRSLHPDVKLPMTFRYPDEPR